MVASDIPHEQATELVKGRETIIDQCRRCRQAWPCEVKVLQDQIKDLADFIMIKFPGEPSRSEGAVETAKRLLGAKAAAPDPASVADAVGSTDDEPFFEGTPSEVQGVTGEPFGAND